MYSTHVWTSAKVERKLKCYVNIYKIMYNPITMAHGILILSFSYFRMCKCMKCVHTPYAMVIIIMPHLITKKNIVFSSIYEFELDFFFVVASRLKKIINMRIACRFLLIFFSSIILVFLSSFVMIRWLLCACQAFHNKTMTNINNYMKLTRSQILTLLAVCLLMCKVCWHWFKQNEFLIDTKSHLVGNRFVFLEVKKEKKFETLLKIVHCYRYDVHAWGSLGECMDILISIIFYSAWKEIFGNNKTRKHFASHFVNIYPILLYCWWKLLDGT